jgi:hypothetical protein
MDLLKDEAAAEACYLAASLADLGVDETSLSAAGQEALDDLCACAELLNVDDVGEATLLAALNDLDAQVATLEARDRLCDGEIAALQRQHVGGEGSFGGGRGGARDTPLVVPDSEEVVREAQQGADALAATVAKLKAKQRKYEEVQADHDAALLAVGLQPGDQAAIAAAGARVKDLEARAKELEARVQEYGGLPADPRQAKAKIMQAREQLSLRTQEFDELMTKQMS